MSENEKPTYSHGHHESVLRSHSQRTAQNSAAYLLKYLSPDMRVLDVGCGPGTITVSLAQLIPEGHVTGIDNVPSDLDSGVLELARRHAAEQGVTNVTFAHGDACDLAGIPEDTYDVVHCHQVLQHLAEPVRALREMRRVAKKKKKKIDSQSRGIVAAREADTATFAWFPETEGMEEWMRVYRGVMHACGGEPDAGRRLVGWALKAGFERGKIEASASTWCFSTPEERAWWGGMWADRTVSSAFAARAVEMGFTDREGLERIARGWREWAEREDGWFAMVHGEIVCRV